MTEEITGLKYQLMQKSAVKKQPISNEVVDTKENTQVKPNYDETRLLVKIQEYENSTSWKITAPLRKLVNFFRK